MGMEVEETLEKIWELHDKLSDAIHSISRTHFLNSVKSNHLFLHQSSHVNLNHRNGFVFVKDFKMSEDGEEESEIQEAKSLNAIRTALENLEDHLQFFHTLQTQQRVERDAATARLEQSRIVLAMRLAKHQGNNYDVINEARAFVGDVSDAGRFASDNFTPQNKKRPNFLVKFLVSGFNFAKNQLTSDNTNGILGNAALFALSMVALYQVTCKDKYILDFPQREKDFVQNRNGANFSRPVGSSSGSTHLDVLLARG